MSTITYPTNVDAERMVLGSILLNGALLDGLRSTIEPTDFALESHRRIWACVCSVYDSGRAVDRVTVINALMDAKHLESCGGVSYVIGLDDGMPMIPALDGYLAILREKATLRKLIDFAAHLQQQAASGLSDSGSIRDSVAQFVTTLSDSDAKEMRPTSTRQMVDEIGIDELLKPRRSEGLRLPWGRLNGVLAGMRPATMTVLAAYTGRGKTSMALQIAAHACRQGRAALYWTMEMHPAALFRRLVTQLTGIDPRQSSLNFSEREVERTAVAWLYDNPIYFDCHSRTVAGFCGSIRQVRSKTRLGLVVVDYLQLIRAAGRAESRTREVGENSRSLKLATMDFDIPFLVLSQFSRPNADKPATIHSLKESGDIENDADSILLLNAPEFSGDRETTCTVNVGKNREGPAGVDVLLQWHPTTQTFHSVEE